MNLDDDHAFQAKLPALRIAFMPSPTLETRIAALAAKRRPYRVLAMAVGGLAAAGTFVAFVLVPRIALARVLEEAQKGLKAERLHTRMTWFVGKKKAVKETWYESGKLRSDFLSSTDHLVELVEKNRRWLYYPHLKVATWQRDTNTTKWIVDAEREARDATEAGMRLLRREPGVVDEGEVVLEGRRFRRLTQTTTQKEGLLHGEVSQRAWWTCKSGDWHELSSRGTALVAGRRAFAWSTTRTPKHRKVFLSQRSPAQKSTTWMRLAQRSAGALRGHSLSRNSPPAPLSCVMYK